ncbi:hypothetical protein B0H13DRAFT_156110 [Mycena leptocephala]|nr:hypothetical protein B0H13DRAFT_156110 [Mycena leptocephala]
MLRYISPLFHTLRLVNFRDNWRRRFLTVKLHLSGNRHQISSPFSRSPNFWPSTLSALIAGSFPTTWDTLGPLCLRDYTPQSYRDIPTVLRVLLGASSSTHLLLGFILRRRKYGPFSNVWYVLVCRSLPSYMIHVPQGCRQHQGSNPAKPAAGMCTSIASHVSHFLRITSSVDTSLVCRLTQPYTYVICLTFTHTPLTERNQTRALRQHFRPRVPVVIPHRPPVARKRAARIHTRSSCASRCCARSSARCAMRRSGSAWRACATGLGIALLEEGTHP